MLNHLIALTIYLFTCTIVLAEKPPLSTEITQEEIFLKRKNYQTHLDLLQSYRIQQLSQYKVSSTKKKKQLLVQVRTRLEKELTQNLFPAWYGTQWDFNGTSNEPGKGKIACGYFVSTTLKHLGYNLNRYKLAQQPSQRIITTFMKSSELDISSRRTLEDVKKKLIKSGDGIYIVGLDSHVGFVVVNGENIIFVHSSYYGTEKQVKSEAYDTRNPLSDSKYRVFGKLFNDSMLVHWLYAKNYKVAQ